MTAGTAAGRPQRANWNGTLVRSRIFDALSLLLPAGEDFMTATFDTWRTQAGNTMNERLRSEVARFIREEQSHRRAHDRYNAALIASLPRAAAAAERASRVTDELASLDLPMKIALVAAFEHLTTLLSREIVEYRRLLVHDDSAESGMWQWHAREELGHCDVAMDVAAHLGLGRTRRVFALVLATGYLGYDVLCGTFALCRCDVANGARRGALFIDACRFAAASLPALARMTVGWWRYVITPARASH